MDFLRLTRITVSGPPAEDSRKTGKTGLN